jgi:peroxiredoxin
VSTNVVVGEPMLPVAGETPEGRLDLADFRGKKHVVLWSYPIDDTPG